MEIGSERVRLKPSLTASGISGVGSAGANVALNQGELGLEIALERASIQAVVAASGDSASLGLLLAQVNLLGEHSLFGDSEHQLVLSGGRIDLPVGLAPDH